MLRSEMTLTLYSVFDLGGGGGAVRSEMTLILYNVFDLFCREVHDDTDTL